MSSVGFVGSSAFLSEVLGCCGEHCGVGAVSPEAGSVWVGGAPCSFLSSFSWVCGVEVAVGGGGS